MNTLLLNEALNLNSVANLVITAKDKKFIAVNQAFCKMVGCESNDLVGKDTTELDVDFILNWENLLDELKQKGNLENYKRILKIRNKEKITCNVTSFKIKIENNDFLFFSFENNEGTTESAINGRPSLITGSHADVTQNKTSEEKLTECLAKLEQSKKEMQDFAYAASHDLQEPLRKIKNYIDLLDRRYNDSFDEKARQYMDTILSGANRMQILLKDILHLSRVSTHGEEFKSADMNILVKQVLDILQSSIKESDAEIVLGKLPVIFGDEAQIGQLLQNLIGNSIKFRGEKKPHIKIDVKERKGEWEFCVSDNGIGFDPGFATRVFQVFQRLHARNEYEGTGIGLAICKKIIERHGGKIWAVSEPGIGADFFFTIPKNQNNF